MEKRNNLAGTPVDGHDRTMTEFDTLSTIYDYAAGRRRTTVEKSLYTVRYIKTLIYLYYYCLEL